MQSLNIKYLEEYEDLGAMKQTTVQQTVTSKDTLKTLSKVTETMDETASDESIFI